MAKFNIWAALPAYASVSFACLFLVTISDVFRSPSLGSIIMVILVTPLAMSFSALLALDAAEAYDLPWERFRSWYSFLHDTPHGALILSIGSFLWFWVLASVAVGLLLATFGGGGTYAALLNMFRYIPLIGFPLATAWHIFNAFVLLGLFPYVIYTGVSALKRLITTRRTGYVEGGVPIQLGHEDGDDHEAEFEGWQSNRG